MLVTNILEMTATHDRSEATRQHLQRVAIELFVAQGYDSTTVDQIAETAGVSHMTFFRHFSTKESVLLDDPYDPAIADAVSQTDRRLDPLSRVAIGLQQIATQMGEAVGAEARTRIRIAVGHPKLRAAMWENTQKTESAIVEALVDSDVDQFEAHVAAGACLGALAAALTEWATGNSSESLSSLISRALDQLVDSNG